MCPHLLRGIELADSAKGEGSTAQASFSPLHRLLVLTLALGVLAVTAVPLALAAIPLALAAVGYLVWTKASSTEPPGGLDLDNDVADSKPQAVDDAEASTTPQVRVPLGIRVQDST